MRFLLVILILMSGCTSKPSLTMYENDERMILKDSFVDLPMPFIYPSMQYQNNIRCFEDHFCSLFPIFKDEDFKDGRYWSLMMYGLGSKFSSGYTMGIVQTLADGKGISAGYNIDISVSISPYSESDRALERGDEEFLRKYYNSYVGRKLGNDDIIKVPFKIEYHGKENYSCTVIETHRPIGNSYKAEIYYKRISCIKPNPKKTMTKTVGIELSYTKVPNLPKELEPIAKDYTYEDLQQRAKRMLDSLYIKDGWDK